MRIRDSSSFREWVLAIRDGKVPTTCCLQGEEVPSWIQILDDLLIPLGNNAIEDIVTSTYPNIQNNYKDPKYLRARVILTQTNDTVDEINSFILNSLPGQNSTYLS